MSDPARSKARAWGAWALLVVTLSGLPQLVLAVEDGIPKTGTEELRSIRSMLFGDRAATSNSVATPSPAVVLDGPAGQATTLRKGAAVPAYVRRGVLPGQPARLGPPRATTLLVRTLHLAASSFV